MRPLAKMEQAVGEEMEGNDPESTQELQGLFDG